MKVFIGPYEDDRKVDIQIDDYDVWSLDHTLGLIILPALKLLRDTKQGSPVIDKEELPEELVSYEKDDDWDGTDEHDHNIHKTWINVLNEMIFAFEIDDDFTNPIFYSDTEITEPGWKKHAIFGSTWWENKELREKALERRQRGLEFFGKYFQCLWD